MQNFGHSEKHEQPLPTARKIRRACSKELYRTLKRLKVWVSPERIAQAEDLYYRKVLANLIWITDNRSNRKAQCDWWDENVCAEIAELWEVESQALSKAFRNAYGG